MLFHAWCADGNTEKAGWQTWIKRRCRSIVVCSCMVCVCQAGTWRSRWSMSARCPSSRRPAQCPSTARPSRGSSPPPPATPNSLSPSNVRRLDTHRVDSRPRLLTYLLTYLLFCSAELSRTIAGPHTAPQFAFSSSSSSSGPSATRPTWLNGIRTDQKSRLTSSNDSRRQKRTRDVIIAHHVFDSGARRKRTYYCRLCSHHGTVLNVEKAPFQVKLW